MNNNKGFTLIEMLVVIAIIGLLSSVVLVALGPSRNKAKDARIISDINQIRAIMETKFNPTTNTYSVTPKTDCSAGSGSTDIDNGLKDIATNGGTGCTINLDSNGYKYAVSAVLNTNSAIYCVDTTGSVGSKTALAGACPP